MKKGSIKISRFNEGLTVFKPDYYLNKGKKIISDLLDKNVPFQSLSIISDKIYQGGIFKRIFVEKEEFAYKYVTASDMVKSEPLDTAKNISIKHTPWIEDMTLKKNQILVSCAGTVGNTTIVNENFSGCIGSQEIIRVETSDVPFGFLYAYLSTSTVNQYIQSMVYGAVVPRISPSELGSLPVLLPEKKIQKNIHNLILEAMKLRAAASKLLRESQQLILIELNYKQESINYTNSLKNILSSHQIRFESNYYTSEGYNIQKHIRKGNFKNLVEVSEKIYRPGIFKRHYVKNGIEFFGGADIVKAIPQSDKKLSLAKTKHLEALKIQENQILVTCGGTIGYTVLVNEYLSGKTASQHILRVKAKGLKTGYLFAFMSSELGLKAIQSFTYGSVIPQIEPHHLELLPIPVLEDALMNKIHDMIMSYKENISTAIEKELEAINLVEKEIEEWHK
jgi:type I restriction enzyme S subunit